DEFDQLSQTINGMLAQIQVLIEGVRNASNTVAHDLRTPLTELRNRLEELLRRRPPIEEAWSEVQGSVGDLDRVIGVFNALLRLADIDSGARLSGFREVRLDSVAAEVAELYGPVAEAKGSDLAYAAPADAVTVQGDPDLLAQAISNLVDNAVKFSPAGGKVVLDVTQTADGAAEVRVRIADPASPTRKRPRWCAASIAATPARAKAAWGWVSAWSPPSPSCMAGGSNSPTAILGRSRRLSCRRRRHRVRC